MNIHRLITTALALAVLTACVHAEDTRSISTHASGVAYVRTASVGIAGAAEAIDLTDISGFGTYQRAFTISITNEDDTNDLLVDFKSSGSAAASELTTPADATVSEVVRIEQGTTVSIDVMGSWFIWQSETAVVNAHAVISW